MTQSPLPLDSHGKMMLGDNHIIGELASPIVSIGDPKSIVLTNQCTLIRKVSPNFEREPQFRHANSDAHSCTQLHVTVCSCTQLHVYMWLCIIFAAICGCSNQFLLPPITLPGRSSLHSDHVCLSTRISF